MAIFRQIYPDFWADPKIVDDFTPEDKYFYLYLMTNPHTNLCGCYEVSIRQMAWETGYNEDSIGRLLRRMMEVHKVIRYDAVTREVLIHNWHKYNWTKSPKLLKSVEIACQDIKNESFRSYVINLIQEEEKKYPMDTLSNSKTYPMHTPVTVTVSDTVSVSDGKKNKNRKVASYMERSTPSKPIGMEYINGIHGT